MSILFIVGLSWLVVYFVYDRWRMKLHRHGILNYNADPRDHQISFFKARRLLKEARRRERSGQLD